MFPYFFLLSASFLFCFIGKQRKNNVFGAGINSFTAENNLGVAAFFLLLFLMLALRSVTVGRDIIKYKRFFTRSVYEPFSQVVSGTSEVLYWLLMWVFGKISKEFHVFLAFLALISTYPIYRLYNQDRRHSFLKILLFLNSSLFVMLFSGLRQSVAIAVGAIAFHFVKKKRPILFIVSVLVAMGFHSSAFILFPMYPLFYFRLKRKHLYIIVPLVVVCFIFNGSIFQLLLGFLSSLGSRFELLSYSSSGAYTSLILYVLFALFSYIVPDEEKTGNEFIGLRNFLLLAVLLQCFTPIHGLAMRMNYYYILFIPVAVPMAFNHPLEKWKNVAQWANVIMCVFFTVYFIYTFVSTAPTGGALDTIPYIPFWQGA